jgi:hypothetical protein
MSHIFLRKGYDPTRNQSEFGAPQRSDFGNALERGAFLLYGNQTLLPGPYHFEDQVGTVQVSTYSIIPVIQDKNDFGGEVPLSVAPKYTRPAPWRR